MQLDESDVYDLLYYNAFEIFSKDYGNIEVIDVNEFVDDVLPELVNMINEKLSNEKIEIIS